MLKSMLKLKGVAQLSITQLKGVKGGLGPSEGIFCFREKDGVYISTTANQTPNSAGLWVRAWVSLGWNANCFGIEENK